MTFTHLHTHIVTEEDETPKQVAAAKNVDLDLLVIINKSEYQGDKTVPPVPCRHDQSKKPSRFILPHMQWVTLLIVFAAFFQRRFRVLFAM